MDEIRIKIEQNDVKLTFPHEHIKNTSTYIKFFREIYLKTGRKLHDQGLRRFPK